MPHDERLLRRARILAVLRALPDAPALRRPRLFETLGRHRDAVVAVVLGASVLAMVLS